MGPERKEPCEREERERNRAAGPLRARSLEQPGRSDGERGAEHSAGNEPGKVSHDVGAFAADAKIGEEHQTGRKG